MTGAERRAWLLVGSLFATRFLVFGSGYNTAGVFFTPLLDHFGWTRAQLSLLQTTLALSAGPDAPPALRRPETLDGRVQLRSRGASAGGGAPPPGPPCAARPLIVSPAL